jgi:hypothetical protein
MNARQRRKLRRHVEREDDRKGDWIDVLWYRSITRLIAYWGRRPRVDPKARQCRHRYAEESRHRLDRVAADTVVDDMPGPGGAYCTDPECPGRGNCGLDIANGYTMPPYCLFRDRPELATDYAERQQAANLEYLSELDRVEFEQDCRDRGETD